MERNKPSDRLADAAELRPGGGCAEFRLGLVLAALNQRLEDGLSPEEEVQVRKEIAALEAKLGL